MICRETLIGQGYTELTGCLYLAGRLSAQTSPWVQVGQNRTNAVSAVGLSRTALQSAKGGTNCIFWMPVPNITKIKRNHESRQTYASIDSCRFSGFVVSLIFKDSSCPKHGTLPDNTKSFRIAPATVWFSKLRRTFRIRIQSGTMLSGQEADRVSPSQPVRYTAAWYKWYKSIPFLSLRERAGKLRLRHVAV